MKHLGWLEKQLNNNIKINETESAAKLLEYQKLQAEFQYPSFSTISAAGDRAAVVHYSPVPETAREIRKDQIYLLDAGGQYSDCTTDITRTHHFGRPTTLERRAYTRVLQGVVDLASTVFPENTYGRSLDHLARMHLFKDGMIYGHGTGHGIGHYLSVHEGPQNIADQYNQYEEPLAEGMFVSDEPGFYKNNDFGIRIENDVEVVVANNKSNYTQTRFLKFNTITILPYERSLIDTSLLTKEQIQIIDEYHSSVYDRLKDSLGDDTDALSALQTRTSKLEPEPPTSVAPTQPTSAAITTAHTLIQTMLNSILTILFIIISIYLF
ncbi:unnamed protein product [Didymodactylos carnosus]|nr:unnamed protein product [Didymodactylos carnosus]CAF4311238.1 unnamed protein product [Didymodactylos carnosus]